MNKVKGLENGKDRKNWVKYNELSCICVYK